MYDSVLNEPILNFISPSGELGMDQAQRAYNFQQQQAAALTRRTNELQSSCTICNRSMTIILIHDGQQRVYVSITLPSGVHMLCGECFIANELHEAAKGTSIKPKIKQLETENRHQQRQITMLKQALKDAKLEG